MQLGVAAAKIDAGNPFGKMVVMERRELDDLGTQVLQQTQRISIVEAERIIARYGYARSARQFERLDALPVGAFQRWRRLRKRNESVDVDRFLHHGCKPIELPSQVVNLGSCHQT